MRPFRSSTQTQKALLRIAGVCFLCLSIVALLAGCADSTPTPEPTPTPELSPTPAAIPLPARVIVGKEGHSRNIRFEVHSLERTPELQFRLCSYDPKSGCQNRSGEDEWRITAKEDHELVAVNVTLWGKAGVGRLDGRARMRFAEIRDSENNAYPALQAWEAAWQSFKGTSFASVDVDVHRCEDGVRIEVEENAYIVWKNESGYSQYIHFEDGTPPIVPEAGQWIPEARWIPEGGSRNYLYQQTGEHRYRLHCTMGRYSKWSPLQVRVVKAGGVKTGSLNYGLLLRSAFLDKYEVRYLRNNVGKPGYLVFEIPKGAELKEIRWLAGEQVKVDLQPPS